MTGPALTLLAVELLGLCTLVCGLFWMRRRLGLAPLFLALGMFQPLQVLLAATLYVHVGAGVTLSPGSMMFAVSLLAILLVYIREDAGEVRTFVVGVLVANAAMSIILAIAAWQLDTNAGTNLLPVPAAMFEDGARVAAVGTAMLIVDVVALMLVYGWAGHAFPRHPLLRAAITLTTVLLFDGLAFATGAFFDRPDFGSMLFAGLINKAVLATILSCFLVLYLRFFESGTRAPRAASSGARDVFYSLTYRDRFEQQQRRNQDLREERAQMFDRITDGFVALDREWRYTFINPRGAEILGKRPEDLIGRAIWDVFPEGVGTPFEAAYRRAMETQEPVAFEAYFPPFDRWFESNVYPSEDGLTMYFRDVTARVERQREAVRRATRDDLTGLLSRNGMRDAIDEILRKTHAPDSQLGVIALGIDRLHQVNHALGYAAGDEVLKLAAQRLETIARAKDCALARTGADGFMLATPWSSDSQDISDVARLASEALAEQYALQGQSVYLSSSAGIATCPRAGTDATALIKNADLAVNLAKQQGRNRIVAHSAGSEALLAERIALISELRGARARGELSLVFQPVFSAGGAIVSAEALLRWTSPVRGSVSPGVFIPAAEEAGLIVDIGKWVLSAALAQLVEWGRDNAVCVPLAVNVSAVQLERPEFVDEVRDALIASGALASLLKLEITESVFLRDADAAVDMLKQLRELGVRISLDDFGTGYSNLGNLRRLPLDEIKIDRSFVQDLPGDVFSATLCSVIVAMSKMLEFSVVAEGVENEAQATFLRDAGCNSLQGFHFARPMPAVELRAMLETAGD